MNDTAILGIVFLVIGVALCLSVVGTPLGVIFFGAGLWMLNSSKGK